MSPKRSPSSSNLVLPLFTEPTQVGVPSTKRRTRKSTGLPKGLSFDDYELDEDGQVREIVREWVRDKHARLERYVGISSAVRKKFVKKGPAGATYIDLFSGPGRVRIRETKDVLHGSPLVAWSQSVQRSAPFTQVYIADAHASIVEACNFRLQQARAPVESEVGDAVDTVNRIIQKVDKRSLHFAFLDPYNLGALSFEIVRKLAVLERMDILIHISLQDLNRNLRRYISKNASSLDSFAPGWRNVVDVDRSDQYVRARIFEHWKGLLKTIRMRVAEATELVSGSKKQPLYWLAFAARHDLAHEFWEKIRRLEPEPQQSMLE